MGGDDEEDVYGGYWDHYVDQVFPRIQAEGPRIHPGTEEWRVLNETDEVFEWPGDEWGARGDVERILDATLGELLPEAPAVLGELGAGSGRYTSVVLERYPGARVLSFDVSERFAAALRARCAGAVEAGRLETVHLAGEPGELVRELEARGLRGEVDALYSFDALVHVDLHTLAVYAVSAARVLRLGGWVIWNVADATTDAGLLKLLANAPFGYRQRGRAGSTFVWTGGDQVAAMFERLGFEVRRSSPNGRDAFVAARLIDREAAGAWLRRAGARW